MNDTLEVWYPPLLVEWAKHYEVSNKGRIRSVKRTYQKGNCIQLCHSGGRICTQKEQGKKGIKVVLLTRTNDGKRYQRSVRVDKLLDTTKISIKDLTRSEVKNVPLSRIHELNLT